MRCARWGEFLLEDLSYNPQLWRNGVSSRWLGRQHQSNHVSTDFPEARDLPLGLLGSLEKRGIPAAVLPAKLPRPPVRPCEVDSGDSHWTAALRPLCFSLER